MGLGSAHRKLVMFLFPNAPIAEAPMKAFFEDDRRVLIDGLMLDPRTRSEEQILTVREVTSVPG